jgi:adenine-specific DNA-methyltransferase
MQTQEFLLNPIQAKKASLKNKFGQYFTPKIMANFMINLATVTKNSKVLEPSCGEGIFIELLQKQGFENIIAYEIDKSLAIHHQNIKYESFISAKIHEKFDLIIGNPPYIRWANLENELKAELQNNPLWNKYFNSLCDYLYIFILKSIELLNENGELIFICPEYWLNTTHSLSLRNYMVENGYFETIYHFNETPIFDKVVTSTIIFKYIKAKNYNKNNLISVKKYFANKKLTNETLENLKTYTAFEGAEYINLPQFRKNERWIFANPTLKNELQVFENQCKKPNINLFENQITYYTLGEFCDIGNGLVSGLDKAFQLSDMLLNEDILTEKEQKNILKVVKAKDLQPFYYENITNYLYVKDGLSENEFVTNFPYFYKHLQEYKTDLEKRYQYNRKIQYWEWCFLRNFALFSSPEKRIFVPCKERISHKSYFRFALAEAQIYPTQDVTAIFCKATTKESIEYILAFLNHHKVFNWLKINGIVKGNIVEFSEKPLASIPFRAINWQKKQEILLHNEITKFCQKYLETKDNEILEKINMLFDELFKL